QVPLCARRTRTDGKVDFIPIIGAFNNHKFDEAEHTEDERRTTTLCYQIRSFTKAEQAKKAKRVRYVKNMLKKGQSACGYESLVMLAPKTLNQIATVVG
ncbi:unnamed protein product, partial [Amoebophrya sp. A25]